MADELTTTEAAQYLEAHGHTVHSKRDGTDGPPPAELVKRWCIAGKLKGRKRENRWLIERAELDRIIQEVEMTFTQAITVLAQGRGIDPTIEWDATIDEARSVVTRAVLDIVGGRDDDGALGDWIAFGAFSGDETAESIAAEYQEEW